jgi:hypothetical protein
MMRVWRENEGLAIAECSLQIGDSSRGPQRQIADLASQFMPEADPFRSALAEWAVPA